MCYSNNMLNIFLKDFDLKNALFQTRDKGYYFTNSANSELCLNLVKEINKLSLEYGDHVKYPINKQTTYAVTQSHERHYCHLNDSLTPVANGICYNLSTLVQAYKKEFPELGTWLLNEIGYQRYRDERDYISPHRDRWSDHLLSVTFTIFGSAKIKIYESLVTPPDYSKLKQIDEYLTISGTVMFLRAPGFGNGEQIIHEVLPPLNNEERLILNLRMRKNVLPSPKEFEIKNEMQKRNTRINI